MPATKVTAVSGVHRPGGERIGFLQSLTSWLPGLPGGGFVSQKGGFIAPQILSDGVYDIERKGRNVDGSLSYVAMRVRGSGATFQKGNTLIAN